jgi:hypothetical protein
VRAVYNATDVAFLLAWDDMTAERSGASGPSLAAPDSVALAVSAALGGAYSDAVAVQIPARPMSGIAKPYFLFGDEKNPVELWFADLARGKAERFHGRGYRNVQSAGDSLAMQSSYEDGQWTVIVKRARSPEGAFPFDEGSFVPVAFSLWDGMNLERGNRRGVTSWYHVYLKPARTESKAIPVAGYGLGTLLAEVVVIQLVRRRTRTRAVPP